MVNARDFTNGQTDIWTLQSKWRRKITTYGFKCQQLGAAATGSLAAQELRDETRAMATEFYTEVAALEQRVRELEKAQSLEVSQTVETVTGSLTGIHIDKLG